MFIPSNHLPGLSVDCVIFGFHEGLMKVLLLKMKNVEKWALPGGFVEKMEHVDTAAIRVLQVRTNLGNVFLKQFHLFGDLDRSNSPHVEDMIENRVLSPESKDWFAQRFVTVGYYALIDFAKANPTPDEISERCEWVSLDEVPELILDHRQILDQALEKLRKELRDQPIGINLLPKKFTMPELQILYERILNRSLDRRNFQRKMLSFGFLKRLEERKKGGAHKAPYLYSFDEKKYNVALEKGLAPEW